MVLRDHPFILGAVSSSATASRPIFVSISPHFFSSGTLRAFLRRVPPKTPYPAGILPQGTTERPYPAGIPPQVQTGRASGEPPMALRRDQPPRLAMRGGGAGHGKQVISGCDLGRNKTLPRGIKNGVSEPEWLRNDLDRIKKGISEPERPRNSLDGIKKGISEPERPRNDLDRIKKGISEPERPRNGLDGIKKGISEPERPRNDLDRIKKGISEPEHSFRWATPPRDSEARRLVGAESLDGLSARPAHAGYNRQWHNARVSARRVRGKPAQRAGNARRLQPTVA